MLSSNQHQTSNGILPPPTSASNNEPPVSLEEVCADLAARITKFLEEDIPAGLLRDVQRQTRVALGVIEECLGKYRLEEISLSYNGGKDCLVLLILLLASLHFHTHPKPPSANTNDTTSSPPTKTTELLPKTLQTVYILSAHPFPEVTHFVATTTKTYALDLAHYAMPMKAAFQKYLDDKKGVVKAILVGTRRTDPHGELLTHFDMTDHGWPSFERVHPVVDWGYGEIWGFIRHLQIPYCELYDQGYTSLGGTTDTHPNPALKTKIKTTTDGSGEVKEKEVFRPAYELVEDEAERLGRDW